MTRQQLWATRAHEQIALLKNRPDKAKQKTYGMKMPGLLHQSGLIQALVFLNTRGEDGEAFVDAVARVYGVDNRQALVQRTQEAELQAYLALSRDIIVVAEWIRRFVQIEMRDVEPEEN